MWTWSEIDDWLKIKHLKTFYREMYQFLEHFVKTVAQAYYLNAKEVVIENK